MKNSEWRKVPLGEIVTARDEKPDPLLLVSGEIPIISKIRFSDGGIEFRSDRETKTGMILIQPGDLVLSGINAMKGAVAIYQPKDLKPSAATIHYCAYKVDETKVDIRFLWYLLRSDFFRESLARQVPQGIKTELKPKRFLPVVVPLPSLEDQRRIVNKLEIFSERVNTLVSLQSEAIDESNAFMLSLLAKIKVELLRSGYPKEKLGKVTTVTSGGTPSRTISSYWNGTIPWIKTGELLDSNIESADEYITQEGLDNSSAKIFPVDTVLIALYGQGQTRGRTGRLVIEAATNQACCAIYPVSCLDPRFIQFWLRSMYTELREDAHGGAQPNWNGKMIKNIDIVIPPKVEQERIIGQIKHYQKKANELLLIQQNAQSRISSLMPSLLDKAIRGELI